MVTAEALSVKQFPLFQKSNMWDKAGLIFINGPSVPHTNFLLLLAMLSFIYENIVKITVWMDGV